MTPPDRPDIKRTDPAVRRFRGLLIKWLRDDSVPRDNRGFVEFVIEELALSDDPKPITSVTPK